MRCRFHQEIGEFAIVGEQQQAFAGVVETAHGIDARADPVKQIHHSGAMLRIVERGDVALGLVHQQINVPLGTVKEFPVYADVVNVGIGFGAQFGDDLPIDRDESSGDDLLGLAARSNSGSSDNFL